MTRTGRCAAPRFHRRRRGRSAGGRPPADILVWGLDVAYAATGQQPVRQRGQNPRGPVQGHARRTRTSAAFQNQPRGTGRVRRPMTKDRTAAHSPQLRTSHPALGWRRPRASRTRPPRPSLARLAAGPGRVPAARAGRRGRPVEWSLLLEPPSSPGAPYGPARLRGSPPRGTPVHSPRAADGSRAFSGGPRAIGRSPRPQRLSRRRVFAPSRRGTRRRKDRPPTREAREGDPSRAEHPAELPGKLGPRPSSSGSTASWHRGARW